MIRIRLLAFGVLKDRLGRGAVEIELPEGATVADLLHRVERGPSRPESSRPEWSAIDLRGIAVSVNAEYSAPNQPLRDGDEVGLLPPVSGGTERAGDELSPEEEVAEASVSLTRERIDAEALVAAAKRAEDGAVVVFDGIVRNHTRGRQTLHLDYEAYEEMAERQMNDLARQAVEQFSVRHVTVVHRLGRLEIGETSVLIVVSSAHRAQAFDACRWLIDTLKRTVPIWKKETFVDGAVWAAGEPFPQALTAAPAEAVHER
jgi:molybdopterin synthase catalytic subunit